jgi:hypothetical protein
MLLVISPAKTLDYESPCTFMHRDLPAFKKEAAILAKELKKLSPQQLSDLMDISPALAELNYARWQAWSPSFKQVRAAILAFQGDVYQGMKAAQFEESDMEYAQQHLRILSGLYGLLRPLDAMQPYRLEMGTPFPVGEHKDLYAFWGDKITASLNGLLKTEKVLINLASQEYFKAVKPKLLKGTLISPNFKELRDGKPQIVSFSAKKARGMMAAFIIKNRIEQPEDIKSFTEEGYAFAPELSKGSEWVFVR